MAAAALAGVQQHPNVSTATTPGAPVVRPVLGNDLNCSCPMVCVVGTNRGAAHAIPLHVMALQFNVQCHISQAFVQLQLVCHYPDVSSTARSARALSVVFNTAKLHVGIGPMSGQALSEAFFCSLLTVWTAGPAISR
jgi:hypothetical protein